MYPITNMNPQLAPSLDTVIDVPLIETFAMAGLDHWLPPTAIPTVRPFGLMASV